MKDVILTTDFYHGHADPNDHWNLASMFALAHLGWINFVGIMCDDDRSLKNDGSFLPLTLLKTSNHTEKSVCFSLCMSNSQNLTIIRA